MRTNFFCFSLFMAVFVCSGCTSQTNSKESTQIADSIPKPSQQKDITLPGGFSSQNRLVFDSILIAGFINQFPDFKTFETRIRQFYANRKYAYAWFDNNGLIEQAGNLYNKIENIQDEGLPQKLLYSQDFNRLMEEATTSADVQKANVTIELMLTAQYFFYAKNVWSGLGSKAMEAVNWELPQKKTSYDAMLDSLLDVGTSRFIKTEPVFRQYPLLKSYLKKYRDIEEAGGWPVIKTEKKTYHKGDSGAVIAAIRKCLYLSGDIASADESVFFDDVLENGVKNFQQRFGFKDDGIINSLLVKELNYPVEKRIEQIIVNMERCRWLPIELKGDYVVVNIPEYRFHAYENDSLAWSMNVVVGSTVNKTAIFSGMMSMVVFSPYWNIPPGILKKETLPAIRRNKNYLARNHMEWNGGRVRQKPGPWNALGQVKFLFPNSHSIYLHDTPSKNAFGNDKRAFSHGCIRVGEPKRLAMYILRKQPEWTEPRIEASMNSGKEQYVQINKPVPVFIAYFTSWVDKMGRLNFRDDVYKRDSRLAKMIIENSGL